MERLTITLTPDLAQRVKSAVDAGNYASASEVMRQALRDWEVAEARRHAELQSLRADVQVGLDEAATGKARRFNAARIVKAGKRRLLEEHELKLRELRAAIDEGDRAYAEGRTTVVDQPGKLTADIIARGKVRAVKRKRARLPPT